MPSNAEPPISKILIREEPADLQSSPNKLPKTEISPLPSKGKLIIKNETSCSNRCGICLSEEGKSIRGYIDTRDHQYMKDCVATKQIVGVPIRDQAYHHYNENITTGHQDSYAQIQCNVCHNNINQSLLLLCDLCDSSSHTYCVGLGNTVPEEYWICGDCTLLMHEHAENDQNLDVVGLGALDPHSRNQNRWQNHQYVSSAEAPVSITDIIKGSGPYNVERSTSNRSRSSPTNARDDGICRATSNVEHNSQAEYLVGHHSSQFAERTVLGCHNRESRIRALRENWDKIRHGSLCFSLFHISKPGVGDLSSNTSSELNSSSSSNIIPDHTTQDIKKAWKMMNAVKSIEKNKHTNNIPCSSNGSKPSLCDMKTPKESSSVRTMLLSSYHGGDKDQDCKKFKRPYQDCSAEKHNDKRKWPIFQEENASTVPKFMRHPDTYSTSKMLQYSVQDRIDHANKNHDSSICHSVGPVAKNRSAAKPGVHVSSSCNLNEVTNVEKHEEAKVDNDVKSEIQSLVKLNLNLLSTKKKLDTNKFKEVARLATHSILAACGIGPPKSWVRPFQSPDCDHVEKFEQVRRSTIMPSSCRECFLVFVKDVVNTILLDRTTPK